MLKNPRLCAPLFLFCLTACGASDGKNGADGTDAPAVVYATSVVAPGADCENGGTEIKLGHDDNGNGVLDDPAETETSTILCNGDRGEPGAESLVTLTPEPAGSQCPLGGTRVDTGVDDNGNGVLEAGEIDHTEYICLPAPPNAFDGLVYVADAQVRGMDAIYRAERDGSHYQKLAGPPPLGHSISAVRMSPDRTKVAYMVNSGPQSELFVLDLLTSSPPVQVSGPMQENQGVNEFAWSPNSDRMLYVANQTETTRTDLYMVLADGSAQRPIARELYSHVDWMPDGERFTYVNDDAVASEHELYVNILAGNNEINLSAALGADADVLVGPDAVKVSPDGSRVAYLATATAGGPVELFTNNLAGTDHQRVSSASMQAAGDVQRPFQWAPDSSRLAYVADETVDDTFGLYTVLPDGTGPAELASLVTTNANLVDGLGSNDPIMFAWSPDSSAVGFVAERLTTGVFELFVATPDAASVQLVSGTMVENGDIGGNNQNVPGPTFSWSPNSQYLAFRADRVTNNVTQLFTVRPDGSDLTAISLNDTGTVPSFIWSPDSAQVLYASREDTGTYDLLASDPAGGTRLNLSNPDGTGTFDVGNGFRFSPDGTHVAYRARTATITSELFTVMPTGGGPVRVSGPIVELGTVDDFWWE